MRKRVRVNAVIFFVFFLCFFLFSVFFSFKLETKLQLIDCFMTPEGRAEGRDTACFRELQTYSLIVTPLHAMFV